MNLGSGLRIGEHAACTTLLLNGAPEAGSGHASAT
jgi:hypothetical protein